MKDKTLTYYNANAEDFFTSTKDADMSHLYVPFLQEIKAGGHILDLGCGSGRDSKHFIQKGFKVTAIDGSEELCKLASEYIEQNVLCMDFCQLDFKDEFDGVWACASLLHVDRDSIEEVMGRLHRALKADGTLYVSFKYGNSEREHNGRFFNDYTEETLTELLNSCGFKVDQLFITGDVREGRGDERWVNGIVKKR